MKWVGFRFLLIFLVLLRSTPQVNAALSDIQFLNVTNLTSEGALQVLRTVAFGTDHIAYRPASSLGMQLGLEVGVSAAMLTIPQGFLNVMSDVGANVSGIPNPLPLLKFHVHKGLPGGVDLGASWFGISNELTMAAFEAQWAFLEKGRSPTLALRTSYNFTKLNFITTRLLTVDLVGSKKIGFMFEPFLGIGYHLGNGEVTVPVEQVAQVGFQSAQNLNDLRYFGGIQFNLFFIKIGAQFTRTLTGVTSYGFKAVLGL